MKKITVLAVAMSAVACTSVTVTPVAPGVRMSHVCIKDNPQVIVSDFVPVVRDGFSRHGVTTNIFSAELPPIGCEYVLTYTALRSWDFAPYLSHAELRIEKSGRQIAYGEFHLRGKGGLDASKWTGTKSKMDPVIDKLFAER